MTKSKEGQAKFNQFKLYLKYLKTADLNKITLKIFQCYTGKLWHYYSKY